MLSDLQRLGMKRARLESPGMQEDSERGDQNPKTAQNFLRLLGSESEHRTSYFG